jgi:hypothetical protein
MVSYLNATKNKSVLFFCSVDIIVFDLTLQTSPFLVSVVKKTNITRNGGWIESMPSWNTDPNEPDMLIYSASR